MAAELRTLYPEIEPYDTGRLPVSGGHAIYWEQSGNPKGHPILFVHGGPGGATEPKQRRFFDPKAYRIVLFDQRGCGKSTPHASLVENTTWHLVADMEALRAQLGVERWHVFGGSWGSTLSLAYAQKHPERVSALVLRGIFLMRDSEITWFCRGGSRALFPDAWDDLLAVIAPGERDDVLTAYHRLLTNDDPEVRRRAAQAWSLWEARTSSLIPDPAQIARMTEDAFSLALARIECHYLMSRGFFERDGQLLEGIDRIRRIPAVIVHGRYDAVCPLSSAWDLHRAWPEARLRIVPNAGHAAREPGTLHELITATDQFRR
jgi:proline iminopeptidase